MQGKYPAHSAFAQIPNILIVCLGVIPGSAQGFCLYDAWGKMQCQGSNLGLPRAKHMPLSFLKAILCHCLLCKKDKLVLVQVG